MKAIKVLLVDDSEIYIEGLKSIFSIYNDLSVAGEAHSQEEAKTFLRKELPDIILLDISLEDDYDGIELASFLHNLYPTLPVIILSHYKDVNYIIGTLKAHVRGYVAKDTKPLELIHILYSVIEGKGFFFGDTLPYEQLIRCFGGEKNLRHCKPYELSPHEIEIISFLADGMTTKEIASTLNIETTTVESYKDRIKTKFGVNTTIEIVIFALKKGIINL